MRHNVTFLKKFFPLLLTLLFFSVCDTNSPTKNNITLQESVTGGRMLITMPAEDITVVEQNNSVQFTGKNIQYLSESGEPNIPYSIQKLLLPPDADMTSIKVTVENVEIQELPGNTRVNPVLPVGFRTKDAVITTWPKNKTIQDGKDIAIYNSDKLFPESIIGTINTGSMRKWNLADVPIAQYQYNPVSEKLYQVKNVRIAVQYSKVELARNDEKTKIIFSDTIGTDTIKNSTINYDLFAEKYQSLNARSETPQNVTYAIITTNAIKNASTQLSNFKNKKAEFGFNVAIITENTWGGGTGNTASENIRNWLKNNYASQGIEYVLLIGNPDPANGDVPMKMLWPRHNYNDYKEAPSDLYYAELTGNWDIDGDGYYGEWDDDFIVGGVDRNFEVVVGRIPFYGNIADLDNILSKMNKYMSESPATIGWRKKVLLPMEPSDDSTPGYQLGEQIKTNILIPSSYAYHRVYEENYNLNPVPETTPTTMDTVTNAWRGSRFGAIFWWTHGWSQGASDIMDINNARTLDNNYPGFTFQSSCTNSQPEETQNLAYVLLTNGAINTVGATRVSWYFVGQTDFVGTYSNSGLTYEYAKRLIAENKSSGYALQNIKQTLTPNGSAIWMNYLVFCIYGDPHMGLTTANGSFTCQPYTATNIQHVSAGRAEVYTKYTISYAKTIGSGEDLGQLGSTYYSPTTTVSETSVGYFAKGNACGGGDNCLSATNSEHISKGRAHKCGLYNMYACANGSNDNLGYASFGSSSIQETATSYWKKCN